jgi:ABC-type Fe3+/spermidine/putrescine transport system ATPase subunit
MAQALQLDQVSFSFNRNAPTVDQVNLTLEPGSFFCLLGPSGCGKTTLLRLVGGYLQPDAGRIFLAGEDITHRPLERRDIGMVFQNYALFPHLSARANVAFGLEARQVARGERERRVEAMLDRVGLAAAERDRRPRELSGGQQQRVALARALVIEPKLLLLDEPLANLDRGLREQLRGELKEIQRRTGVTTLFVTHDQEEALSLADMVGVMVGGRLLQVATPRELYEKPRTPFVARFVGHANLLEIVDAGPGRLHLRGGLTVQGEMPADAAKGAWLLIRPENLLFGPATAACPTVWETRVIDTSFLGADQIVRLEPAPGVSLLLRCRPTEVAQYLRDGKLTIGMVRESLWVIPALDSEGVGRSDGR